MLRTWVPYSSIRHLGATAEYLDLLGCVDITELKAGKGQPPDDPQVYLGSLGFSTAAGESIRTHRHKRRARQRTRKPLSVPPHRVPQDSHPLANLDSRHPPTFDHLLANLLRGFVVQHSRPSMDAAHAFFERDDDGVSGLLKDPDNGTTWKYPPELLRAYRDFDKLLRRLFSEGDTEGVHVVVPGGYPEFQRLWNLDRQSTYLFSAYDPVRGSVMPAGRPIPVGRLVPEKSAAEILRQQEDEEKEKERAYLEQDYIRRERRKQEFITQKRQARQHERAQKLVASKLFGAKPANIGPPGGGRHGSRLSASAGISKRDKGKYIPRNIPTPSSSSTPIAPASEPEPEDTPMLDPEPRARPTDASATLDTPPIEAPDRDRAEPPVAPAASVQDPAPPSEAPPPLPATDALSAAVESFADRALPSGLSFKKKSYASIASSSARAEGSRSRDTDVQMRGVDDFNPESIIDYDEEERTARKQTQKKRGRQPKEKL